MRRELIIYLLRNANPNRPGSKNFRRWLLLRDQMTVGEFIDAHAEQGIAAEGYAIRYLRVMEERGFLRVPGDARREVHRGPRASRTLALVPFSDDLNQFTFGVEFEVNMPMGMTRAMLADKLTLAGIPTTWVERADHMHASTWKVVIDLSLSRTYGAEVKSPILRGAEGLAQVEKMAALLKSLNCKANRAHGLHVHVGVEHEQGPFFYRSLVNYSTNERLIDAMHPISRRHNRYCSPIRLNGVTAETSRADILRLCGSDKFRKLNLQAYATHRTIEFRQAAGTVFADRAVYWVKFVLRMALAAHNGVEVRGAADLPDLFSRIGMPADEQMFWTRRTDVLNRRLAA